MLNYSKAKLKIVESPFKEPTAMSLPLSHNENLGIIRYLAAMKRNLSFIYHFLLFKKIEKEAFKRMLFRWIEKKSKVDFLVIRDILFLLTGIVLMDKSSVDNSILKALMDSLQLIK